MKRGLMVWYAIFQDTFYSVLNSALLYPLSFSFIHWQNKRKKQEGLLSKSYSVLPTLVFLINEHARKYFFWKFSTLLALIRACLIINFLVAFLPACLLHPARLLNPVLFLHLCLFNLESLIRMAYFSNCLTYEDMLVGFAYSRTLKFLNYWNSTIDPP